MKAVQSCPSLCPWNFLGHNIGVGSLSLLQGIFPTQGSNPGLPLCRGILYQLSHRGSWYILEWVAYPFSRGSSRPRNRTRISWIAGRFFTSWAKGKPHAKTLLFKRKMCTWWGGRCSITTLLKGQSSDDVLWSSWGQV